MLLQMTTLEEEYVLEENDNQDDKVDIKDGQEGAQSFKHGSGGGPNYEITKVRILISREADAPDRDLVFSIGTTDNGVALANSTFNITPGSVTNDSSGDTFQTYNITFSPAVG